MITNYDVFKVAILLTFLGIVCAESGKCPNNYWACKNGQCIRNEEVCDGPIHCKDGSDETAEQCLLIPCPSYAFQCAYGGCITGDFKCNGFKECADGSDENRFLCNKDLNFAKEIQGSCQLPQQMQCKTGECISSNNVCDGLKDCPDGSDETVDLCSFEKCPHETFRCGYGACIAGTSKCNLISDCLDGSDELSNVCVLGYRPDIYKDIRKKITEIFPVNSTDTTTTAKPLQAVYSMGSTSASPMTSCISYVIPNNNIINSTNYCPLYYWSCNDGQCIRNEEVCDGTTHCVDGSDETVAQCLDIPCPSFAFRCAYGACITGNFKCNGIEDCNDGSDENRFMCNTDLDFVDEIHGACRTSAMECKSGECIDNELVCDGLKHCPDGSDETVDLCGGFNCPPFAFRCGYGACVAGSAKCNAIQDCMDGSDELYSICGPSCKPTTHTNTTIADDDDDIANRTPMVTTTERSSVINKYCSAHKLRSGISTQKSCFFNSTSVSCYHNLRPGTRANITCATGYVEKQSKKKHHFVKCENNGEWNNVKMKCIADCGTLTEDQKISTIKPWDLSIFKRNYLGLYTPICSGVIVSPKVVLTAAKCMMNHNDNSYVGDHVVYNVIPGFYNMTYSQGDDLNVDVHNISDISFKTPKRTEGLAVLILVNYFEFSINLKPICLPNIDNDHQLLSDNNLNIGRPFMRDDSRIHLEYLTANANIERKTHLANYVNVYRFLPYINHKIGYYDYLL